MEKILLFNVKDGNSNYFNTKYILKKNLRHLFCPDKFYLYPYSFMLWQFNANCLLPALILSQY